MNEPANEHTENEAKWRRNEPAEEGGGGGGNMQMFKAWCCLSKHEIVIESMETDFIKLSMSQSEHAVNAERQKVKRNDDENENEARMTVWQD